MSLPPLPVLAWVQAGCSVIPITADGSKRPAGPWKAAQSVRATVEVAGAYAAGYDGLGVVCGAVSGHLEMFELEGRAVTDGYGQKLREACRDNGIEHILDALMTGCLTQSPSGGFHLWFRTEGPARGNTKLARRPGTTQPVEVLIETRGEGGYAVVPPSAGTVHVSGNAWTQVAGSPLNIPTISVDERDALYAVASLLDEMPVTEGTLEPVARSTPRADGSKRPGDDYNERATWDEILGGRGWTKMRRLGSGYAWKRPGKTDPGMSATTGQSDDGVDRLYVFTTSTEFDAETPYTKFGAYTLLEHGGDYSASARALRAAGYGDQTPAKPRDTPRPKPAAEQPVTDGSSALATVHALPAPEPGDEQHRGQLRFAERMTVTHGQELRHVHGIGWHVWDGTRWAADEDGEALRTVVDTLKAALLDLTAMSGQERDDLYKDIRRVESSSGLNGVLDIAGNLRPLAVTHKAMDCDPYLFNTPVGTIDLRTGDVAPHNREQHITKCAAAGVGDEHDDEWMAFLERILPDIEVRTFIQRLIGYSMLGEVREHIMPIFTGEGANGKGTLRDAVMHAFGDYAHEVDPAMLMESKHERHGAFKMQLRGRRLVFCSETERGRRFAEATMKRLVGGDPIEANLMHRNPISFIPSHTLIMLTNHLPQVSGDDPAVRRRMLVVPFDVVIPEDERDGTLKDRLKAAAPAVLRWAIEGWRDYQRVGLRAPEAVRMRTEEYLTDSDALGRFVHEECIDYGTVGASDLFERWREWCRESNEDPGNATAFGRALSKRPGITKKTVNGRVRYVGIDLQKDDAADARSEKYA